MYSAIVEVVTAEYLEIKPEEKAEMIKQYYNYEKGSIEPKGIDIIQDDQRLTAIVIVKIKECESLRETVGLEPRIMFLKFCSVKSDYECK